MSMTSNITSTKTIQNILAYFGKMSEFDQGYFLGQTELLAEIKRQCTDTKKG